MFLAGHGSLQKGLRTQSALPGIALSGCGMAQTEGPMEGLPVGRVSLRLGLTKDKK